MSYVVFDIASGDDVEVLASHALFVNILLGKEWKFEGAADDCFEFSWGESVEHGVLHNQSVEHWQLIVEGIAVENWQILVYFA